ncbi:MAG: Mo-dependent nitrogenase C-terminal domain-containing protein [Oscillatoria sp. PMC 1051.18]|nr:Mo-dependent nitrogenase C-terminal domain-containing protein [Oscillatoria sp. PMC 1050.18]MEC5032961.1 Mo-dependent nitrogenase C-terminal domain-containing protein [Oscillatoria sp. PMC 1051.18]
MNTLIFGRNQSIDWLYPLRQWLNQVKIENQWIAHLLCRTIPVQCPFERDIYLFGRKIAHIPPLCKLNPLYEEVVGLRFRALCYLADECGEDIRCYC